MTHKQSKIKPLHHKPTKINQESQNNKNPTHKQDHNKGK